MLSQTSLMFGRGNLLSQRCHILCKSEISQRGGIFKRFQQVKNAAKIKHLCGFGDLLKILNLQQIFRIVKMSMKILYLHWVEVTPQLCKFPGVTQYCLLWAFSRIDCLTSNSTTFLQWGSQAGSLTGCPLRILWVWWSSDSLDLMCKGAEFDSELSGLLSAHHAAGMACHVTCPPVWIQYPHTPPPITWKIFTQREIFHLLLILVNQDLSSWHFFHKCWHCMDAYRYLHSMLYNAALGLHFSLTQEKVLMSNRRHLQWKNISRIGEWVLPVRLQLL